MLLSNDIKQICQIYWLSWATMVQWHWAKGFPLEIKVHNWLRKGEKPCKFEWSSTRSSKACSNSASSRSLESNASYQDKAFDGKTETGELMAQDPFIKKERCTQDPFIKKGEMQNISQRYWKWRRN